VAVIAWSDVTAIAGELSTVTSLAQTIILGWVNTTLDVGFFAGGEDSPKLKLTRIYLAAHLGSLGPHVGVLTGEKEDDLEQSYTLPPIPPYGDPFWYRSSYGAAYQMMVNSTAARLPFVAGS